EQELASIPMAGGGLSRLAIARLQSVDVPVAPLLKRVGLTPEVIADRVHALVPDHREFEINREWGSEFGARDVPKFRPISSNLGPSRVGPVLAAASEIADLAHVVGGDAVERAGEAPGHNDADRRRWAG